MGIPQLTEYIISDFFSVFYFGIFMKRRYSRGFTAGMLALNWGVLVSMEYLRFWLFQQGIATRSTILMGAAAGFLISIFLSDYRDSRTVFILLMSISYCMCGNLAAKLLNFLQVPLLWTAAAEIAVHLALLYLMIRFLLHPIRNLQKRYRKEWRLFSMVLGMFSCCMYLLYACLKRPDARVFHHVVPLFYLLCMYVIVTLALLMLVRINEEEIEASQQKILDAGMEVLKREVEQVQQIEKKIAEYNHDSRHFNRMIAGMLAEGNYGGVKSAIEKIPSFSFFLKGEQYCENLAFDGILSSYAKLAKERGIGMMVQAAMPELDDGRNWEYAVIFDYLLELAAELSGGVKEPDRREIHVRIVPEGSHILYEIRNTFAGQIPFDRVTQLPVFSNQERRGFGMGSIRLYVERRNGTFKSGIDGDWYYVRMLMPHRLFPEEVCCMAGNP